MGVKMDWLLGKLRESDTTTSGGSPITGTLTPNELVYGTGANTIASLPVATYPSLTEIAYVKGVTSAIQTQLNAKQGTITFGTGVQTALGVNVGSAGAVVLFNGALGTPSSGNLANCTFPTLNQNTTGSAATLTTTRTIWGQNFNGSANVTGTLALSTASITMTGSIAATGARVTKGWFTDLESTNMPTVGGVAILSSLTAPTFNTIEIGTGQTDTTISRASAGRIAVEGVNVVTTSSTDTLTNKTLTKPVINGTDPTAATYTPASGAQNVTIDCAANNMHFVTGNTSGTAITFLISNVTNNQPFIVSITQGTTPSTIAAWFATIKWAGGVAPTLTAVANKRDVFGFYRTGTNTYDGFIVGQNL